MCSLSIYTRKLLENFEQYDPDYIEDTDEKDADD